jgi:peptide deformylase
MPMTKDDIITLPNTNLRQRSHKIGLLTDDVRQLIVDMEAATINWEESREHEVGVALAAVQVNKLMRIIVVRNDFDNKDDKTFSAFINPTITKYEGELEEDYEGCLSVPDIYGRVKRYNKIRIRFLGLDNQEHRITAQGFLARVFQHEIDHTNGLVFIDHIKNQPEAFFRLNDEGTLDPVDYEKDVRNNHILW